MDDDAGMQQALDTAQALVESGNVSPNQLIAIKQQLHAAAERLQQKPRIDMPDWGTILPPELFGADMARAITMARSITSSSEQGQRQAAVSDEVLIIAKQFLVAVKALSQIGGIAPGQGPLPGPHVIRRGTK